MDTPPPATGLLEAVKGGQLLAHAPAQLLFIALSLPNTYRVRPLPSTRIVPSDVLAELTLRPELEEAAGFEPLLPLLLPPPPQPAITSASTPAEARVAMYLRVIARSSLNVSFLL